jgi:hypothetical protein
MFEQRRGQRGAAPEDKVRAVLRLDAANALDDVRPKALERAPFKTFRTVGSDIFCCRIEAVRHRTARRLWPEARPDIVGAMAKQQIEALALRGEDCISANGGPIGRGPVAVGEIIVIGGVLDHAVQRDVFDDFELSHLSLRVLGCQHPSEKYKEDRMPQEPIEVGISLERHVAELMDIALALSIRLNDSRSTSMGWSKLIRNMLSNWPQLGNHISNTFSQVMFELPAKQLHGMWAVLLSLRASQPGSL